MKNDILKFLEIQGYKKLNARNTDTGELVVRVKKKSKKNKCPACQSTKVSVHAKGNWVLKKHSNFQEKIMYLEVKRDRLICLKCKKVFAQELPGIPKYARKTSNFVKQSLQYLSKNSFAEVGRVNQISYTPLKNQLHEYVNPHELLGEKIKVLHKLTDIYLGIDGQSFRGKDMILTITEVKIKELLTILPSELQVDLTAFCEKLPVDLRLKVKGIAMDMTNKHSKVLRHYFPNALIVIDHYHVIQLALRHTQNMRRTLQSAFNVSIPIKKELDKNREDLTPFEKEKLRQYFERFPQLQKAYLVKERIRSIYKVVDHDSAQKEYILLKDELLCSRDLELQELGATLSNWEGEILNYFHCRITNAYTEGIHTKCKLIKRKSYGFRNVDTYVRKLILGLVPLISIFSIHTF